MKTFYSVLKTDCEEPKPIVSNTNSQGAMNALPRQLSMAARYTVICRDEDYEVIETLNGQEWLEKYTWIDSRRILK